MIIKAKNFESVTKILEAKHKDKKFFSFMDFQDCLNRIKGVFNDR